MAHFAAIFPAAHLDPLHVPVVQEAVYDDLGLPPGAEALPPRRLAPAEGQLAVPPVISGDQQELRVDDLPLQGEQVDRPR